jgi:hypothetical protein
MGLWSHIKMRRIRKPGFCCFRAETRQNRLVAAPWDVLNRGSQKQIQLCLCKPAGADGKHKPIQQGDSGSGGHMKEHLSITKSIVVGLTVLALVAIGSNGFAKAIYAQLSSDKVQLAGAGSKAVEMENVDANSGFDVTPKGVTIKESGVYFVMVEGQGGVVKQNQSQGGGGYVKLWIQKNGELVSNTVSEKYVTETAAGTFVTQSVMPLMKGDSISVAFSSNKPGAGLVMIEDEPKATSIGFSIFKIAP